jgi:hypothetical protein
VTERRCPLIPRADTLWILLSLELEKSSPKFTESLLKLEFEKHTYDVKTGIWNKDADKKADPKQVKYREKQRLEESKRHKVMNKELLRSRRSILMILRSRLKIMRLMRRRRRKVKRRSALKKRSSGRGWWKCRG